VPAMIFSAFRFYSRVGFVCLCVCGWYLVTVPTAIVCLIKTHEAEKQNKNKNNKNNMYT
jgi:hypothetical protein